VTKKANSDIFGIAITAAMAKNCRYSRHDGKKITIFAMAKI
jgi:hypothetical protein